MTTTHIHLDEVLVDSAGGRARLTNAISVYQLGTLDYEVACQLQAQLAAARARGSLDDLLLLVEHPPVITIGQGGGWEDLLASAPRLRREGIRVLPTDRGGRATYHGPGQRVAYPIFRIPRAGLHHFVWQLEESVIRTLACYDLVAERREGYPGVWLAGKKIAAVGLAVRDGITSHGLALNVAPELAHFGLFVPCGIAGSETTSMKQALARQVDMAGVTACFVQAFAGALGRKVVWRKPESLSRFLPTPTNAGSEPGAEQPSWLWQRLAPESEAVVDQMEHLLAGWGLHTVCQEARCPNIVECFGRGTATFLILGDTCTRGCRFCAVQHGQPLPLDVGEPNRVATAAARLGLQHVVITSVTRDDLADGGAAQFAATIDAVRRRLPAARVEVLIPDLGGAEAALRMILDARPHVLNHNLETVPRLYARVRSRASYQRSLALLARARTHAPQMVTKSGLMLGLGEHTAEVLAVMRDLRRAGCDLLTLGQYLQPTPGQVPVQRYVPPQEFESYRDIARGMGFKGVAAGPLTRSSHRAEALWAEARQE